MTVQPGSVPLAALIPAYEDVFKQVQLEQALPVNLDPLKSDLGDPMQRRHLVRYLEQGLGKVIGYVLPIKATTSVDEKFMSYHGAKMPKQNNAKMRRLARLKGTP